MEATRPVKEEFLSRKVARGGVWIAAVRVASRAMTVVRSVVLARLLAPEDFGVFGITVLGLTALETISQTGFQTALIQQGRDDRDHLDTAWTVSLFRGMILCAVLFAAAPAIATFFRVPQTIPLIRVMSLSFLISGASNVGVVLLNKELEFKRIFCLEGGGSLADLGTAVFLAFLYQSVWALVGGVIAGNLARAILSYLFHPYRPRLKIRSSAFAGLIGYGGWVNVAGIIIFLDSYGDDIFIGRMLGADALGFYQMAFMLANVPATEFTRVISNVTFPAYSKLHQDKFKFRTAFLKVLHLTGLLVLPLSVFLFVAARPIVHLLLGPTWLPMIPAMEILCLYGAGRAIGATMSPVLYASGKPKSQAILSLLQFLVMLVLIYPLTKIAGIEGTAFAVTVAMAFVLVLISLEIKSVLGLSAAKNIMGGLLPFVISSGLAGFTTIIGGSLFASLPVFAYLFAVAVLFFVIYVVLLLIWNRFINRIFDPLRELYTLIFRSSSIA